MRIELTEVLSCPRCPSTAGLIALIERADGSRVVEGALGCPFCEARYPVRAGEADLTSGGEPQDDAAAGARQTAEAWHEGASPAERALALAALLGLQQDTGGYVLLDEALCPLAERVAQLAPRRKIIALVPSRPAQAEPESAYPSGIEGASASRVRVDLGATLPVLHGRLSGIALLGPDTERLRDATLALGARGRLVVLEPDAGVPVSTQGTGLRVLASDERALVAVRAVVSG
jgi:uncharacterized protein YbaR (Trm112 family)